MNIFVIDRDPKVAAKYLVDRHVAKMVAESAQILSNCFTLEQLAAPDCPRTQAGTPRKHSYPHHPCCKWAKESRNNMLWIIAHAAALDEERMRRFGSETPHFSMGFINWAHGNIKQSLAPAGNSTPFVQAMPDEFKNENAVLAYRNYYKYGKINLHKWTNAEKPCWI